MNQTQRTKKQKEIVDSIPIPAKSLLYLAPRLGKTLVVINYIKKHKINKVLWVTPSKDLAKKDIKEEFIKWEAEKYLENLTTSTYSSLNKVTGFYDLVVLDEVNSITSNNLINIFLRKLVYTSMIGMTGTPSRSQDKLDLIDKLGLSVAYELLIDKAVDMGILADYKVNVLKIPYDSKGLKDYEKWQKIIDSHTVYKIDCDFELQDVKILDKSGTIYLRKLRFLRNTDDGSPLYVIQNGSKSEGYVVNGDTIKGKLSTPDGDYKITGHNVHKSYGKNLNIMRQKALGSSLSKTTVLSALLKGFNTQRNVVFTSSIEQSNKISKHTFNSSTSNKYLKKFQKFETTNLVLVNTGGTGFTYEKIDNLIIGQCNNDTNGDISQKISRSLLKQDIYQAKIWLLMIESTPDEKWVKEVLKSFNSKNVNYISYDKMEG